MRLALAATLAVAAAAGCSTPAGGPVSPPAPVATATTSRPAQPFPSASTPILTPPQPTLTLPAPTTHPPLPTPTSPGPTHSPPKPNPAPHPVRDTCPPSASTVVRTTPNSKTRTVALTFDDGPGKDTPAILAILARHHVHATFFMIGRNVTAHPTWARQVAAAGHAIGNHTYDHPLNPGMNRLAATGQATQIDKATRAIHKATSVSPCYFRAPGGNDKNPTTLTLARTRHMTVANWTYDPRDWAAPAYPSPSYTARIVANATGAKPHPIVLMHDGGGNRTNTVAALDQVVNYYQRRGYTFTTPDGHPFPTMPGTAKPAPKPKPTLTATPTATATPTTATPTTTETATPTP